MSTRIIIEKDGERYEANNLIARFICRGRALCIESETDYVASTFTKLTPVIRTDNSEVIARLERGIERRDAQIRVLQRENAKMREALKDVLDVHLCDGGTTPVSDALCAVRKAQETLAHGCASTQKEKK